MISPEQALQATRNLSLAGLQVVACFGILSANRYVGMKPADMEAFFLVEGNHAESH